MAKRKMFQDVYWSILGLTACSMFSIGNELFFIISAVYYVILILPTKKVCIPRIPGMNCYLIWIIYSTIIGSCLYSIRNVARDLFYVLPTVLWIFIGYTIGKKKKSDQKSMIKTLYLYSGLISTKCLITFLLQFSLNFDNLRSVFGSDVYEVGLVLPLIVYQVFLCKERIFSRRIDWYLIVVMFIQITMSFGRIAILEPTIALFVIFILSTHYKNQKIRIVKQIAVLAGAMMICLIIVSYILPENVLDTFIEKFMTSFTEIDANQTINSVAGAMQHWRAYEVQSTIEQWVNSNLLVQLFGGGMGCQVYLRYIPYTWIDSVVDNRIPILHNGFYTLLLKGGLLSLGSLIWIFLGTILKGLKMVKCKSKEQDIGIILVAINVACMANTYVVLGPVQQGAFLVWGVLMGWLFCMYYKKSEKI